MLLRNKMLDSSLVAEHLSARFHLDLSAEHPTTDRSVFALRIGGIDPPNGFRVDVASGWRSMEASFRPDPFASGLVKTLCSSPVLSRREFSSLSATFVLSGSKCLVHIDGREVEPATLPDGRWSRFELSCLRLTDKQDEQKDAEEVASACLALLLTLLPVEQEAVQTSPMAQGLPEGALVRLEVNRYERSPANRAAAIAAHGAFCHACKFDFGKFYGKIGEGFIEVHHRTPVSEMGGEYVVNPIEDLVPLCSNCHQIVHRETPPISPEKLRHLLVERGAITPEQ